MADRRHQRTNGSPREHAREAVDHWRQAVRYAREALSPGSGGKGNGGRLGDAADAVLAKLGLPGRLASKLGVGSRTVAKLGAGDGSGGADGERDADSGAPIPIQQSIEVAVAPKTALALCKRFDEYPAFLERVHDVEELDDGRLAFDVRLRGSRQQIVVEIVGERAGRRIDWESLEGPEHVGTISFHQLAPGLTHIELSVDLEPHGLIERLARSVHLTERTIRAELQRFKAYAELWEEEEPEEGDEVTATHKEKS